MAIVYASTEGQTKKIVGRIEERLSAAGMVVEVVSAAEVEAAAASDADAVIVAGSVHQGQHQKDLVEFVKASAPEWRDKKTAFVSVSMAMAALSDEGSGEAGVGESGRAEAQKYVDGFAAQSGWQPPRVLCVAGALRFTQYDWLKRQLMKMISKKQGFTGDAGKDHEFTDWDQVDRFVDDFIGG